MDVSAFTRPGSAPGDGRRRHRAGGGQAALHTSGAPEPGNRGELGGRWCDVAPGARRPRIRPEDWPPAAPQIGLRGRRVQRESGAALHCRQGPPGWPDRTRTGSHPVVDLDPGVPGPRGPPEHHAVLLGTGGGDLDRPPAGTGSASLVPGAAAPGTVVAGAAVAEGAVEGADDGAAVDGPDEQPGQDPRRQHAATVSGTRPDRDAARADRVGSGSPGVRPYWNMAWEHSRANRTPAE